MQLSPGEQVRETAIKIAADPTLGLNPAFVSECTKRKLTVPVAANSLGLNSPFDFGPNSATVFRSREDIDWLEQNSQQQYPCLLFAAGASVQATGGNRVKGIKFQGTVTVEIRAYIAWYIEQPPPGNNFEAHLDAIEQAFITVFNRDVNAWLPSLYSNMLNFPQRLPLMTCNNGRLLRRGIVAHLQAGVYQF